MHVKGNPDDVTVEVRCPDHPIRLLLRVGTPKVLDGANIIEVACRDCRNDLRKRGETVSLVLHRYNVLGEHVQTEIKR